MKIFETFPELDPPHPGIQQGDVCMWDAGVNGDDYPPVAFPHSNLDKLDYHSRLDYRRVKYEKRSTDAGMASVFIPIFNGVYVQDFTLFAHGVEKDGVPVRPLIAGEIVAGGSQEYSVAGSAILAGTNGLQYLTLSADETYVYLNVRGWFPPGVTVGWIVRVYEEEFQVPTVPEIVIRANEDEDPYAQLASLSAEYGYVRENVGAPDFAVIGEQTIELRLNSTHGYPEVHYSDGLINLSTKTAFAIFNSIPPLDPPTFTASKVDCST